jgi:hypothetical protein
VQAYDVGGAPGGHRRRRLTSRRGDLVGLIPLRLDGDWRKQGRAKKVKQGETSLIILGFFGTWSHHMGRELSTAECCSPSWA